VQSMSTGPPFDIAAQPLLKITRILGQMESLSARSGGGKHHVSVAPVRGHTNMAFVLRPQTAGPHRRQKRQQNQQPRGAWSAATKPLA